MNTNFDSSQSALVAAALRRELIAVAQKEEDLANAEAARVPYWQPHPPTVHGHREAARALREEVARLEAVAGSWSLAG